MTNASLVALFCWGSGEMGASDGSGMDTDVDVAETMVDAVVDADVQEELRDLKTFQ